MLRQMLIGKIHRAKVTAADLNYVGSITIDKKLIEAAGIHPWELVQVADINNGERFETYVMEGEAGSGQVQMNGAAARLVQPGDLVIIMAYAWLTPEEIDQCRPRIVLVDDNNQIEEVLSS